MSTKQKVGLLGAIVLAVGVFLPYQSGTADGTVSYWSAGGGGGTAVLGFALLSAFLVFVNRSVALWYSGLATLVLLVYGFVEHQFAREDSLNAVQAHASGVKLADIGEYAAAAPPLVELQWGFGVLCAGVILVLAGAIVAEKPAAA